MSQVQQPAETSPVVDGFRKPFKWVKGQSNAVHAKLRFWLNHYNEGEIHRSRAIPDSRYGMEIPRTEVSIRLHYIPFRYGELKWLSDTLNLEDSETSQAVIFQRALKTMEDSQMQGRYAIGTEMEFKLGLTKDELGYVYKLIELIGFARDHRLTPSEQKLKDEGIARGDW